VYDSRSGYATQAFAIDVAGGNRAPTVADLQSEYAAVEVPFGIGLLAVDPEGNPLTYWARIYRPALTSTPAERAIWVPTTIRRASTKT
jgi:hypothetical protein